MRSARMILIMSVVLLQGHFLQAQHEFYINNNGLIYPDSTIAQLKHIVDSLNLKFKACELNRNYHSVPQALAHYVKVTKRDAVQARKDIQNGIPFEELIKKYPSCTVQKDMLVTREDLETNNTPEFEFSSIPIGNNAGQSIQWNDPVADQWAYTFYNKKAYGEESIEAFYFTAPFHSTALPERYARLVQYADCLIDTSTIIYTRNAYRDYRRVREKKPLDFFIYLSRHTGPPPDFPSGDNWEKYNEQYAKWSTRKDSLIHVLSKTDSFHTLLATSLEVARKKGGSGEELEVFVERYISPAAALELKRGRIVVGGCSQDMRPREHAFDIARLSASAVKWDVFLRAHLDIMNDNFERASDGSYAWGRRETYIRELEVLDINVPDLVLGIVLRVADPAKQHYYGSISRVGRALAESTYRDTIEITILNMISDPELDVYNRLLAFYLFLHYNDYVQHVAEKNENVIRLKESVRTLPAHLSEAAMQTIARFTKTR